MHLKKSIKAFKEAERHLVGGVNSPVRAFKAVSGSPVFFSKGKGQRVWDLDGNVYLDFVGSWGPLLLGHAPSKIVKAIKKAAGHGTSFGAPTLKETLLAKKVSSWMPSIDLLRLVNSGTEATMSAIRLARGYTGRDKIIKFEGCYHGHADSFLIKAGSGTLTLGEPSSPGVTSANIENTLIANYNDLESVKALFDAYKERIAAVIVEPVAGNMGLILPKKDFLSGLRNITSKWGALLIFDEVITGFRLSKGGAQEYFKVKPDLTTLGKIIGGGLPVGAYGGKKAIMEQLSPLGSVYQAGTLSGNPLAVGAGYQMLQEIEKDKGIYSYLDRLGNRLARGISNNFKEKGIASKVCQLKSMLWVFFGHEQTLDSFKDVSKTDEAFYKKYHLSHLKKGVYLPPSAFEIFFVSRAHRQRDIDNYLEIQRKIFKKW